MLAVILENPKDANEIANKIDFLYTDTKLE